MWNLAFFVFFCACECEPSFLPLITWLITYLRTSVRNLYARTTSPSSIPNVSTQALTIFLDFLIISPIATICFVSLLSRLLIKTALSLPISARHLPFCPAIELLTFSCWGFFPSLPGFVISNLPWTKRMILVFMSFLGVSSCLLQLSPKS